MVLESSASDNPDVIKALSSLKFDLLVELRIVKENIIHLQSDQKNGLGKLEERLERRLDNVSTDLTRRFSRGISDVQTELHEITRHQSHLKRKQDQMFTKQDLIQSTLAGEIPHQAPHVIPSPSVLSPRSSWSACGAPLVPRPVFPQPPPPPPPANTTDPSGMNDEITSIIDSILSDPEIKHCGESGSVISIDSGVRTQGMESTGGCPVINMPQPVNLSKDPNVVPPSFDLFCTGKQVSSGGCPLVDSSSPVVQTKWLLSHVLCVYVFVFVMGILNATCN